MHFDTLFCLRWPCKWCMMKHIDVAGRSVPHELAVLTPAAGPFQPATAGFAGRRLRRCAGRRRMHRGHRTARRPDPRPRRTGHGRDCRNRRHGRDGRNSRDRPARGRPGRAERSGRHRAGRNTRRRAQLCRRNAVHRRLQHGALPDVCRRDRPGVYDAGQQYRRRQHGGGVHHLAGMRKIQRIFRHVHRAGIGGDAQAQAHHHLLRHQQFERVFDRRHQLYQDLLTGAAGH